MDDQKTCLLLRPYVTDANDKDRQENDLKNIKQAITKINLRLLGPSQEGIVVQDISFDLIEEVYYADVIVIDVNEYPSAINFLPYLYYLKGWSHALWDKTILVAQKIEHLPLSLQRSSYTLGYSENPWGFFSDFQNAIKGILEKNSRRANNPIQSFLRGITPSESEELAKAKEKILQLEEKLNEANRRVDDLKKRPVAATKPERIEFRRVPRKG